MFLILRLAAVALVCVVLTDCSTTTTALEPQHKPQSAGNARIYVLRPPAWTYAARTADVKINGALVGEVANNSYLSVDRPPGRYTLGVKMPFDFGASEHEFQAAAGRSYYFVINMKSSTYGLVGGGVFTIHEQSTGQPVQKGNFFATSYLAELDPPAGAAALAKLKAP